MTVKRYDAMHKDVWTDESGKYVRYEDYATLKARMDMIQGLMSAAEQANALAKEEVENLVKERNALAVSAAEMQSQQKVDVYDMLREDYGLCEKSVGLADFVDRQAKRIAELEAASVKPVKLPDEFATIGENLRTQDNRITSDPMFCVFQKREVVADEDYDHDRIVWVDEDGKEATELQATRLELLHDNCREAPATWRRIAVKEIDDFVTCCFTEQGCKDYLACNGHNLRLPFIYVKSGFRNSEYQTVRNWLMTNGTVEGE